MKNKFLFVVVCMFLLIGALAPMVFAQDKLQMWRNSSSGVNVSWVDNNGNWYMMGDLNITGDLLVNGANTTGDYVPYTGSISNVALGNYNFSVGGSDFVQGGNN